MPDDIEDNRRQAMTRLFGSCVTPASPQPAMPATDSLPAPCADAARNAANPVVLATGSLADVHAEVLRILSGGLRHPVEDLTEGAADASAAVEIDSMLGVFVCSVIADVLGRQGMAPLRGNCEPGDFASVDSVARLVCRLRRVAVAS